MNNSGNIQRKKRHLPQIRNIQKPKKSIRYSMENEKTKQKTKIQNNKRRICKRNILLPMDSKQDKVVKMTLEEKYKGCRTKMNQMIQETQGEVECFV